MAENVTITTFLELKDNMSDGLKKVEAALKNVNQAQTKATKNQQKQAQALKPLERNAYQHAKQVDRIAQAQERAAKAAQRANERTHKEQLRQQREIAKAQQGPKNDPVARMVAQERISRRIAHAKDREQRQIARAQLGPKYDPAARAQQQVRAQEQAARRNEAFQRENAKFSAQKQRDAAKATEFAARQAQKQKAQSERLAAAELRSTQRAHAAAARSAELTARRKAAAELRAIRQVESARKTAHRHELQRAKAEERAHKQAQKETRELIAKAGAAMFGPSAGGFLSAGASSPQAAAALAAIAALEAGINAVKAAASTAFDLLKGFVVKSFEVGQEFQNNIRRVSMTLTGLEVTPSYEIANIEAEKHYNIIRELAAKLPGEAQDYLSVFSAGLPMALEQGERSIENFTDKASKFTAIAFTRNIKDVQHIGRDIERIMQGNALSTTRMYRELRPYIGMIAKDFNKLSPEQRMTKFYAAIDKAAKGLAFTFHDADAVMGTLQTKVEDVFRIGGQPLFKATLEIIEQINKFLTDNNTQIMQTVKLIATDLSRVLRGAVGMALQMAQNFGKVKESLISALNSAQYILYAINPLLGGLVMMANKLLATVGKSMYAMGEQMEKEAAREKAKERLARSLELEKEPGYAKAKAAYGGLVAPEKPAAGQEYTAAQRSQLAHIEKLAMSQARSGTLTGEAWAHLLSTMDFDPGEIQSMWTRAFASRGPLVEGMGKTPKTPKGRQTTINDFRFSKFDIRQEFAEGFDPDRIAVAFASDLANLGEMRMQSAYAPLFAIRGGG